MKTFDDLRESLVASCLMSAEIVDAQVDAWKAQTSETDGALPQAFLDWLVENELITDFQGDAIAAGHSGPFTLGPYKVFEHLAAGRLGGVFRAVHEDFDQTVSLKIFPSVGEADSERVARIGRELRVAIELDHPNVVSAYQLGKVGDTYFLAMEDLQGETLENKLEIEGSLTCEAACGIVQQLANGLAHLHDNDVLHRDIRPANVWINSSGTAKLTEFGAARDAYSFLDTVEGGQAVTTSETILGMYDYMAPEQAKDPRDADQRSDIYALGCTLYHTVAGRVPFVEKNPAKLVLRHASDAPELLSAQVADLPHQLDETLAGFLAKNPDDRYQKAENAAYALNPFVPKAIPMPPEVGRPVSSAYLEWAQSSLPADSNAVPTDAVAVTPELTQFLDWMSRKKKRRKKKRRA
jgi:serine/threonine protein kinase